MDVGGLIFGVAMTATSLSIRWRWPAVPKWFATLLMVAGICSAIWSFTAIPVGLAASMILNVALLAAVGDYAFNREKPAAAPVPDNSERDQERALTQIGKAIEGADLSLIRDPSPDLLRMSQNLLNSTFLTIKKTYDVDGPMLLTPSKQLIALGVDFLMEVQPFLEGGHTIQAKRVAEDFLKNRMTLR